MPQQRQQRSFIIALGCLACAVLIPGCKSSENAPPTDRSEVKGANVEESATKKPLKKSLRQGFHPLRSLLSEESRAELWSDGIFINLGTPDQHKYTRGGWRSGWGKTRPGPCPSLEVRKRQARLEVLQRWGSCARVAVRARSARAGQKLTLYVDGEPISTQAMSTKWKELSFPLTKEINAGRHIVTLTFTKSARRGTPAALVDWVWLAAKGAEKPPPAKKADIRVFGSPRRALVADPPRRLSYYVAVPEETSLVFQYGASKATTFEVVVGADGEEEQRLFKATAQGSKWEEARVDLAAWAGKVARLDLITRGEAGEAGWGEPDLMRPGAAPTAPAVKPQNRARNLIYILMDTARQDVYPPFNSRTHVKAPAMEKLALDSVLFANAYANDNWTKPGVATALSGLYSSTHGTVYQSSVLPRTVKLLPQHLKAHGFDTAAFIANGYISRKFGFKKGWNIWRNHIREELPHDAEQVYADALKWLSKPRDKRAFLYIQTIDPHVPYAVPSKYLKLYYPKEYRGRLGPSVSGYETKDFLDGKIPLTEDDKQYIRGLYDGEITYHDKHMGLFLDALAKQGRLDDTLVVVSNDHGEEMFEHGKVGHGHSLHEELIRCPLLLRFPKLLPKNKRISTVVGLVDLAPTVLQLLGVSPLPGMEGASLVNEAFGVSPPGGGYAIAEWHSHSRAVRLGPYKLITSTKTQLYKVTDDPSEQEDLSATHPLARRACEIHLYEALAVPSKHQRLLGTSPGRRHRSTRTNIGAKLKRQLEALGYIN